MPTAEMLVAKLFFNRVISTKDACFMMTDISNFYLMTPFVRPEHICIKLSNIPDEITKECNLMEEAIKDGSVYTMAIHGMYGIPHSCPLTNELLVKRLNKRGYRKSKLVPDIWKHN